MRSLNVLVKAANRPVVPQSPVFAPLAHWVIWEGVVLIEKTGAHAARRVAGGPLS
jgi:hypothetical protein